MASGHCTVPSHICSEKIKVFGDPGHGCVGSCSSTTTDSIGSSIGIGVVVPSDVVVVAAVVVTVVDVWVVVGSVGLEVVEELKVEETVLVIVAFVNLAVERVGVSVGVVTEDSNVVFKLDVVAVVAIVVLTFSVDNGIVDNGVVGVVALVNGKNCVVDVILTTIALEDVVKVLSFAEEVEADWFKVVEGVCTFSESIDKVEFDSKLLNENAMLVVKCGALVGNKVVLLVVIGKVLLFVVVGPCNQNGRVSNKSDEFPTY